jgi:hypothetical protein
MGGAHGWARRRPRRCARRGVECSAGARGGTPTSRPRARVSQGRRQRAMQERGRGGGEEVSAARGARSAAVGPRTAGRPGGQSVTQRLVEVGGGHKRKESARRSGLPALGARRVCAAASAPRRRARREPTPPARKGEERGPGAARSLLRARDFGARWSRRRRRWRSMARRVCSGHVGAGAPPFVCLRA